MVIFTKLNTIIKVLKKKASKILKKGITPLVSVNIDTNGGHSPLTKKGITPLFKTEILITDSHSPLTKKGITPR